MQSSNYIGIDDNEEYLAKWCSMRRHQTSRSKQKSQFKQDKQISKRCKFSIQNEIKTSNLRYLQSN